MSARASGALLWAVTSLAGCALREVTPGHYVLGTNPSSSPRSAGTRTRAASANRSIALTAGTTPPPPSAQTPASPPNWTTDLPTVEKVRASVRGTDVADTTLRQQAAFNILRQLIREFSGFGKWPPAAVARFQEYDRASPDRPTTGPANPYEMVPDFQRDVLSGLVSTSTLNAYVASSWFAEVQAHAAAVRQTAQKRAAVTQATVKVAQIIESLTVDHQHAEAAHIDMAVFGITLGAPLQLPNCPASGNSIKTCVLPNQQSTTARTPASESDRTTEVLEQGLQMLDSVAKARRTIAGDVDITSVPIVKTYVLLGSADRPDWLALWPGRLVVSQVGGFVVAITMGPLGPMFDGKMEAALTEKYRGEPTRESPFTCTNEYGVSHGKYTYRSWSMPGLRVGYEPSNGLLLDCGAFDARFETATFRRLKEEARVQNHAAQPKL